MKSLTCFAAIFAIAATPATAVAVADYAGVGSSSCGKWIEGREFNDEALNGVLVAWIQGFLSGMNVGRYTLTDGETAAIPDAPSLLVYVDKFCRENPT